MHQTIDSNHLSKLPHKLQVVFAIFCAKQVAHLIEEKDKEVCLRAIDIAIAFTEDKATKEDCTAYASAAYAAAVAAVAAGYAAADAVYAYSDKETIIEAQWTYYDELLSFVDGRVDSLILE